MFRKDNRRWGKVIRVLEKILETQTKNIWKIDDDDFYYKDRTDGYIVVLPTSGSDVYFTEDFKTELGVHIFFGTLEDREKTNIFDTKLYELQRLTESKLEKHYKEKSYVDFLEKDTVKEYINNTLAECRLRDKEEPYQIGLDYLQDKKFSEIPFIEYETALDFGAVEDCTLYLIKMALQDEKLKDISIIELIQEYIDESKDYEYYFEEDKMLIHIELDRYELDKLRELIR